MTPEYELDYLERKLQWIPSEKKRLKESMSQLDVEKMYIKRRIKEIEQALQDMRKRDSLLV